MLNCRNQLLKVGKCYSCVWKLQNSLTIADFDPEDDAPAPDSDEENESGEDDEAAATEHYEAVGYVRKFLSD